MYHKKICTGGVLESVDVSWIMVYLPNSHLPVCFWTGMVLCEKTRNIDAEGGFEADISFEEFHRRIAHK